MITFERGFLAIDFIRRIAGLIFCQQRRKLCLDNVNLFIQGI